MDYLQYALQLGSTLKKANNFVLNLVINGLPSILKNNILLTKQNIYAVLNLVINGLPSIQNVLLKDKFLQDSFKPCYKWITFNTKKLELINLKNTQF